MSYQENLKEEIEKKKVDINKAHIYICQIEKEYDIVNLHNNYNLYRTKRDRNMFESLEEQKELQKLYNKYTCYKRKILQKQKMKKN